MLTSHEQGLLTQEDLSPTLSDQPHHSQLSLGIPVPQTVSAVEHDTNTDQKLITVTEDKAFICLNRNLRTIGKRRWTHPLSLLISLLLSLATSEFDKLSWISADLLKASFIVASIVTTGWFIWEMMHAGRLKGVTEVIHDVFDELRGIRTVSPIKGPSIGLRDVVMRRVYGS